MTFHKSSTLIFACALVMAFVSFPAHGQWLSGTPGIYYMSYVGIGTSSPADALEIQGNDVDGKRALRLSHYFNLENPACISFGQAGIAPFNGGYSVFARAGDLVIRSYDVSTPEVEACPGGDIIVTAFTDGGSIRFGTKDAGGTDTEKMTILNNGNVGIGADNPQQKLVVDGTICAHEVRVALTSAVCGWPDYVFDDNYELASLEEVEQHIDSEGHLPGIPSAEEVENNGIHIGEMQARLLEKVEELTLYLIQQNKKIEAQEDKIATLQAKLDTQEQADD